MFCIPIIAEDTEEALNKMNHGRDLADIFEIRLDLMKTFDIPALIHASPKPVLVTYRTVAEGGKGRVDFPVIADYLIQAIQSGAALVDVERILPETSRQRILDSKGNAHVVLSTHIVDHTPSRSDLRSILDESVATGADIIKIVTWAGVWQDTLRVMELVPQAVDRALKIIAFCMGPMGRISRIFSHLMGAHMSFASMEMGQESAAGQIPIQEMKKIIRYFSQ
jgi:3-dehydroquinate dehydratase type I